MSHSAELIQSILALVQQDYPAHQYRFLTEQMIPGTRMFPDIQVQDSAGKIICAVEIGYTHPEKLTTYRKTLKIPDVRWYDKKGTLHADVEEKVVKVRVEADHGGFFFVYRIDDMVNCHSEWCENEVVWEWNYHVVGLTATMTDEEENLLYDKMSQYLCEAVCTMVITDYVRVWFVCFCDKCGNIWAPAQDDGIDLWCIAQDLENLTPRQFARDWNTRRIREGTWKDAVLFVRNHIGLEPNYEDGEFIDEDSAQVYQERTSQLRVEAMSV